MRSHPLRVAIVASRFNGEVTERLLAGALEVLKRTGVIRAGLQVLRVPGAFEVPQAVSWLVRHKPAPDAVVAIGCILRGETDHHDHLARSVLNRLLALSVKSGVPVGLGVVTAKTEAQAMARAGGRMGNRGADAARAALEMLKLKQEGMRDARR